MQFVVWLWKFSSLNFQISKLPNSFSKCPKMGTKIVSDKSIFEQPSDPSTSMILLPFPTPTCHGCLIPSSFNHKENFKKGENFLLRGRKQEKLFFLLVLRLSARPPLKMDPCFFRYPLSALPPTNFLLILDLLWSWGENGKIKMALIFLRVFLWFSVSSHRSRKAKNCDFHGDEIVIYSPNFHRMT